MGEAAKIFKAIAEAGINIDMIVQNVSAVATGRTDISFTLPRDDGQSAMTTLRRLQESMGFESLLYDDRIGKVSLIGAGHAVSPRGDRQVLQRAGRRGSEHRDDLHLGNQDLGGGGPGRLDVAVTATHKAFELDADQVEAVVYGGTGR